MRDLLSGPRWKVALGGAALLGVVLATQLYVWTNLWPLRVSWAEALLWSLPQLLVWLVLMPIPVRAAERFPIGGARAGRRVAGHALASVLFSGGGLALLDLSDRILGWSTLLGAPSSLVSDLSKTLVHVHLGVALYWVVLGVVHALRSDARARRREVEAARLQGELARAQLRALKLQLEPHFLFNTLNSIDALLPRDPQGARRMLHRLSGLLHRTLREDGRAETTVKEELDYLEDYLGIEQVRLGERLSVDFEVEAGVEEERMPALLLQPLVENAVRHGIAPREEGGRVRISVRRSGGSLEICVEDDGPGVEDGGPGLEEDGPGLEPGESAPGAGPAMESGRGLGLSNVRKRLEATYGSSAELSLEEGSLGGLAVRVRIPARGAVVATGTPTPTGGPHP